MKFSMDIVTLDILEYILFHFLQLVMPTWQVMWNLESGHHSLGNDVCLLNILSFYYGNVLYSIN